MTNPDNREIPAKNMKVECLPGKSEELEKCRFCVHSVRFKTLKGEVPSPARAYCSMTRATESVDLKTVTAVICDDHRGEGFRSMLNVIG